jgi:hypothetical protein
MWTDSVWVTALRSRAFCCALQEKKKKEKLATWFVPFLQTAAISVIVITMHFVCTLGTQALYS